MTPKQDPKARNLAAIGGAMPEILDTLTRYRPRGALTFDAEGRPDVLLDGRPWFGKPYHEHLAEQMRTFLGAERRFTRARPEPGAYDEYGNRFARAFLAEAEAAGITFADKCTDDESYFLIVLGPGLGDPLDGLEALTGCRSLIVADRSPEMLYHSLETYDWETLVKRIRDRGARITFLFSEMPEALSYRLAVTMRVDNPCALDGATVYVDRSDPMLVETTQRFVAIDRVVVTTGLGFFNDECLMMRNAYLNLRSGDATMFCRTDDRVVETPVFIVASGPSVDAAFPVIKENADRAIIVSCGTGLRPLLVNGVKPDFHVESENISVSPVLDDVSVEHDLSPICLVAAATVERRATEFFDRAIYYFRPGLSPFPLYCETDDTCLRSPSPNIVNSAFSFAQDSGARTIYLFGVDLGVKELGGQHHSAHSYYYADNALLDPADLGYSIPVKANFGGTAYTTDHLYLTGRQLSLAVADYGTGGRYYNCSDGARIARFEPMAAERIELASIAGGKAKAVNALIESFPVYSTAQFEAAWDADGLAAAINAYADEFIARARALGDGQGKGRGKDYLDPLVAMLHPEDYFSRVADIDRREYTAALFLRGSLYMTLMTAEYFLNRATDPDQLATARRIVETELVATVERLREIAIETLSTPERIPDTITNAAQVAEEFIPEAPTTWGKVSRNAPCPCGSGKRYKNCHGAL